MKTFEIVHKGTGEVVATYEAEKRKSRYRDYNPQTMFQRIVDKKKAEAPKAKEPKVVEIKDFTASTPKKKKKKKRSDES